MIQFNKIFENEIAVIFANPQFTGAITFKIINNFIQRPPWFINTVKFIMLYIIILQNETYKNIQMKWHSKMKKYHNYQGFH